MNICAECKHFIKNGVVWYDQFCGHSKKRRKEAIDPVTGYAGYLEYNAFGDKIIIDNPHPYARDINTDGNCSLYESIQLIK